MVRPFPERRRDLVTVHQGNNVILLKANDIAYLQGNGNYTYVHTVQGQRYLVSKTMKAIDEKLGGHFLRIHKSYFVNPDCVVAKLPPGYLLLNGGQTLPIAKRRLQEMEVVAAIAYLKVG
jgi:two-component system LytT family response regulator